MFGVAEQVSSVWASHRGDTLWALSPVPTLPNPSSGGARAAVPEVLLVRSKPSRLPPAGFGGPIPTAARLSRPGPAQCLPSRSFCASGAALSLPALAGLGIVSCLPPTMSPQEGQEPGWAGRGAAPLLPSQRGRTGCGLPNGVLLGGSPCKPCSLGPRRAFSAGRRRG